MMRKTAIVTGGSRGIGFGIALELAKHGYNIAILDVNDLEDPSRPDYKENMAKLEAAGRNICTRRATPVLPQTARAL